MFLYIGAGKKICAKVYCPARFCQTLGYNQQLLKVVDSRLLDEKTSMEANVH